MFEKMAEWLSGVGLLARKPLSDPELRHKFRNISGIPEEEPFEELLQEFPDFFRVVEKFMTDVEPCFRRFGQSFEEFRQGFSLFTKNYCQFAVHWSLIKKIETMRRAVWKSRKSDTMKFNSDADQEVKTFLKDLPGLLAKKKIHSHFITFIKEWIVEDWTCTERYQDMDMYCGSMQRSFKEITGVTKDLSTIPKHSFSTYVSRRLSEFFGEWNRKLPMDAAFRPGKPIKETNAEQGALEAEYTRETQDLKEGPVAEVLLGSFPPQPEGAKADLCLVYQEYSSAEKRLCLGYLSYDGTKIIHDYLRTSEHVRGCRSIIRTHYGNVDRFACDFLLKDPTNVGLPLQFDAVERKWVMKFALESSSGEFYHSSFDTSIDMWLKFDLVAKRVEVNRVERRVESD